MPAKSSSYVVIAPLVISKKEDGSDLFLYEGAQLPEWATAVEIDRLSALGFIVEVSAAEAATAEPAAQSN